MTEHAVQVRDGVIRTARLTLRPWALEDAEAALAVYGQDDVARWLSPAMDRVRDVGSMRALLQAWTAQELPAPQGRWAVLLGDTDELVGGVAVLPLPPEGDDLEIGYQLAPQAWGRGIAKIMEACRAAGTPKPALRWESAGLWVEFKFDQPPAAETSVKTPAEIFEILRRSE